MLPWYYCLIALFVGAAFGMAVTAVCVARGGDREYMVECAALETKLRLYHLENERLREQLEALPAESFEVEA